MHYTDEQLEKLAAEFLENWESFQQDHGRMSQMNFEAWLVCRNLKARGFIADHIDPHVGEYAIQHKYTGVAFFTGSGELAFTQMGLPFVKKICDLYRERGSCDMQVMKVEY